jgi:hypothetical protein
MLTQKTKEKLRGEFLAKAEELFEQALAQGAEQVLSLSQMEETVGQLKFELTSLLVESMVEVQRQKQAGPGPRCASCGQEMQDKGQKRRRVMTTQGQIELKRNYYYCDRCRQGFFPPGPTVGSETTGLE